MFRARRPNPHARRARSLKRPTQNDFGTAFVPTGQPEMSQTQVVRCWRTALNRPKQNPSRMHGEHGRPRCRVRRPRRTHFHSLDVSGGGAGNHTQGRVRSLKRPFPSELSLFAHWQAGLERNMAFSMFLRQIRPSTEEFEALTL
jgi:hypothetical protein